MRPHKIRAQAVLEFLSQYSSELLILVVAIAAVYAIQIPTQQQTYSPSYCYISPALPCGQVIVTSNSIATVISVIFTNDVGQSIYLPGDPAFYAAPTATSAYTAGTCGTTATSNVLRAGSSTVCSATISGFTVRAGAQLQPLFYINYEICSNPTCSSIVNNPSTFRGENTAGSAVGYVTPTGGVSISPPASTTSTSTTSTTTSTSTSTSTTTTVSASSGCTVPECMYVANQGSSNVVIVNTATNTVVGSVNNNGVALNDLNGVTLSPGGTYGYLTNDGGLDPNTIIFSTSTNIITGVVTPTPSGGNSGNANGAAFAPNGTYAYIPLSNINVVDTSTNTVTGTINMQPYGGQTSYIAFSPDGTYAYITTTIDENVLIFNIETNSVVGAINNGFVNPWGVVFTPNGRYAYVANENNEGTGPNPSGNVVVISTSTNTIVGAISSGMANPTGVAVSADGNYLYVANYATNNIVIFNTTTNALIGSITGGISVPYDIAFYPGLTVTISPLYTQTIISGDSVTFTATGHAGSGGYSYQWYTAPGAGQCSSSDTAISGATSSTYTATPSSTTYYCVKVTDSSGGTAYSWATEVVVNVLNSELEGIAVSPDGSTVYVSGTSGTLLGGPTMYAINTLTNSVLALPIYYANQVAVTPDGKYVYATNVGSGAVNYIYKISTLTDSITNTISIDVTAGGGGYVAITPDGKTAYLGYIDGSAAPNSVYALNTSTNTITNSILVGPWVGGGYVAAAPDNSLVYADIGSTNAGVNVISTLTNTVVNSVSFNTNNGYNPSGMAITPSGALLYVASASGNIIVVSTSTNSVVNAIPGVVAVGTDPSGLAITPSGSTAYATNLALNTISVINIPTNTVTNTIQNVGYEPVAVAFSPNGEYAYAASSFNTANTAWSGRPYGEVDVIDVASNTVIKRINYTDSSS
ncbi:MAG: YncE family protein [Candidatus Marsarchaeota archaeon]|nr:YncE family protein [Candidatus Marsarchaeota archaeon]